MKTAIIVISTDYMGRKNYTCAWDGDTADVPTAVKMLKHQARERWAEAMYIVTQHEVTECYRKRGSKLGLNERQIEDAKNYIKKFS